MYYHPFEHDNEIMKSLASVKIDHTVKCYISQICIYPNFETIKIKASSKAIAKLGTIIFIDRNMDTATVPCHSLYN